MNSDDPLAYFIPWTVYGIHLQGDERGWRLRGHGPRQSQPRLQRWHQERLKHPIFLLSSEQRVTVEVECQKHSEYRCWKLWAVNARTNHVHAVVSAHGYSGATVRDQLKANATRGLREQWQAYRNRPVWSVGGDWECVNNEDDLETVCLYVREAQDRMEFKQTSR